MWLEEEITNRGARGRERERVGKKKKKRGRRNE
jgi:hypothetical protein